MTITNPSRLGTFAQAPFKWAVANLPAGPTGIHSNRTGGAGFAINANTKNKDAAWAFLQYLAGPEGQSIFASATAAAVPAMTGNPEVRAAFKAPFADVFPRKPIPASSSRNSRASSTCPTSTSSRRSTWSGTGKAPQPMRSGRSRTRSTPSWPRSRHASRRGGPRPGILSSMGNSNARL
jgi:ABC-type glycerol-3-phosphate transport system substrate-binding protein